MQALRQARSYIGMGHSVRIVTARYDRTLPRREDFDGVPVTRLATLGVRFLGSIVFLGHLAAWLVGHRSEFDAVLVFHVKQPAMVAALLCPLLGKRVVVRDEAAGEYGDIEALGRSVGGAFILWACKKAPAFISGSRDTTEELIAAGITPGKIRTIPCGIPLEAFSDLPAKQDARRRLGIPEGAFVAVNVGRQTAQKDLRTLLAAWRQFLPRCPGALLLLVGDGDEKIYLAGLSAKWGLRESVRFEGWRENVGDYLAAADVFVSCSISEGTHIALGEAMVAALPVIATPVGGARDFVRDGENGCLVDIGDTSTLARRLLFLATDTEARLAMGKAARETAVRELAQEETARRHLETLFRAPGRARSRRRLRVTHIIATLDRGGSERQMAELAVRIDREAFETKVLCLTRGGPTAVVLAAGGVEYRILRKKSGIDIRCFFRLVRELFLSPPTVVHTWLFTANLYGRLGALVAGVRNIVASERSTDPWKSKAHRAADRLLAAFTGVVAANSAAVKRSLCERGLTVRKVKVIPNGVDVGRFGERSAKDSRFALGLGVEGPYFGYIGRLAFEKRPELFVEVAKNVLRRHKGARAVLFGDGPMKDALEEEAADSEGKIIFYGDCPKVELAHAALDCLVLTSQWEGFPNVVLEAMASARPVVAVRMDATEEIVEPGVTGLLVDDDAEALADAVCRMIENPLDARRMGVAGRRAVESRYSMEKMVAAYEALYREVTGLERPRPL